MAMDVPTCGYWLLRKKICSEKCTVQIVQHLSLGHGPDEPLFRNDLHLDEKTRNNVSILEVKYQYPHVLLG